MPSAIFDGLAVVNLRKVIDEYVQNVHSAPQPPAGAP
jgi:hypothetical protein